MSARLAFMVSLLAFVAVVQAQTGEPAKSPKSADAKKALAEYRKAIGAAKQAFETATDKARNKLVGALLAAEEKATKAGDLEEAKAIRDLRKKYEGSSIPESAKYPDVAGIWEEGPAAYGIKLTINQTANSFRADGAYRHPQHGEIKWFMTGTVSLDGEIRGRLTHSKAPKGWVGQFRVGLLSADGSSITGRANSDDGNAHDFVWRKISAKAP